MTNFYCSELPLFCKQNIHESQQGNALEDNGDLASRTLTSVLSLHQNSLS